MIGEQRCLLLVDDEVDFRKVLRDHFEDLGYVVVEAGDGVEALEAYGKREPQIDLVITDIRMPRLDGEALIRELRRMRPHLPIIGVTGHSDLRSRLEILDQGAYYYLDKPLPQWPIVDRLVDNAIRLHRYEEQFHKNRAKETEIARLLYAWAMQDANRDGVGCQEGEVLDLDIRLRFIENDRPSGDYVEWFRRGTGEILFYVADASGHDDLLSCFLTCLASMIVHRSHHGEQPSLDSLVEKVDSALDQLRRDEALGRERFLTFFIGTIDLRRGELLYVNAGHPEAFLLGADGDGIRHLAANSRPVGFLFGEVPEVARIELRPGDLLFVYTDGASEMLEEGSDAASGVRRLGEAVEKHGRASAEDVVEGVAAFLTREAGSRGFPDDTTLLAVKVRER